MTAYALERPDGQWSLMLINKDHDHSHQVRISFHDADAGRDSFFAGAVTMITFGKDQYVWHEGRKKGYADPDGPAATSKLRGEVSTQYNLPAASLTVLRGRLNSAQP